MKEKLAVSVIGLGKQGKKYIDIINNSNAFLLDSVVTSNLDKNKHSQYNVDAFSSVEELISRRTPDVTIVCLPHYLYSANIEKILISGVDVIKEKPFATDITEANLYKSLQKSTGKFIFTTVERRFSNVFMSYHSKYKPLLGKISHFSASYKKNISDLSYGWRSSFEYAKGGALLDMGYHYIDILVCYFGKAKIAKCILGYNNKPGQKYDVEDTANILIQFNNDISGNLSISRVSSIEEERITIYGSDGTLDIQKEKAIFYDSCGNIVDTTYLNKEYSPSEIMINDFATKILKRISPDDHYEQVDIIEKLYRDAHTK